MSAVQFHSLPPGARKVPGVAEFLAPFSQAKGPNAGGLREVHIGMREGDSLAWTFEEGRNGFALVVSNYFLNFLPPGLLSAKELVFACVADLSRVEKVVFGSSYMERTEYPPTFLAVNLPETFNAPAIPLTVSNPRSLFGDLTNAASREQSVTFALPFSLRVSIFYVKNTSVVYGFAPELLPTNEMDIPATHCPKLVLVRGGFLLEAIKQGDVARSDAVVGDDGAYAFLEPGVAVKLVSVGSGTIFAIEFLDLSSELTPKSRPIPQ